MNFRRTAALAVAVLLVGGFYYWYEVEGSKRRRAAEERRQRLLTVEPEAVSSVSLHRGEMTLRAERRGDRWHLTSPIETRADQDALANLVRAASRTKKLRVIDEEPKDPGVYGLSPPRLTITMKTAETETTLAIGEESPTGLGVYARAGSQGSVVLLEREAERAADKELLAFRDKHLFEAPADEVTGVRLVRGDEAIAVEKGGEEDWRLTEPLEAPADSVAVEDLLEALTSENVEAFIDEPTDDPSAYGLATPQATLILTTQDGRTFGPLHIGKYLEAKEQERTTTGRLYARRGEGGPVLVLDEKLSKAMPADADALRDRRLLTYDLDNVERLEVTSPEETVVVDRRGERAWVITKPLVTQADDGAVRNLLWDLKALRAKEFLDQADPNEARFGLAQPLRRFRLRIKGQSEALFLEVGTEAKGGAGRYVRASDRKGLVAVAAGELGRLKATSLSLRDRRLLVFETEAVRRLKIAGFGRSLALSKDGSAWQLTEPERRELKPGAVTALLWTLKRLNFSGVVEERRASEPTGEVLLEARLWTDAEKPQTATVVKDAGQGDGRPHATCSAKPGLYTVDEKDLEEVGQEMGRLLAREE